MSGQTPEPNWIVVGVHEWWAQIVAGTMLGFFVVRQIARFFIRTYGHGPAIEAIQQNCTLRSEEAHERTVLINQRFDDTDRRLKQLDTRLSNIEGYLRGIAQQQQQRGRHEQ